METEWEGHVVGIFKGYAGGRIFELSDGRCWRQESRTSEYLDREPLKARLLRNQSTGTRCLDVEGTSNIVEVKEDRGMGGLIAGRIEAVDRLSGARIDQESDLGVLPGFGLHRSAGLPPIQPSEGEPCADAEAGPLVSDVIGGFQGFGEPRTTGIGTIKIDRPCFVMLRRDEINTERGKNERRANEHHGQVGSTLHDWSLG